MLRLFMLLVWRARARSSPRSSPVAVRSAAGKCCPY